MNGAFHTVDRDCIAVLQVTRNEDRIKKTSRDFFVTNLPNNCFGNNS
jgi:hypothetical protein